MQALKWLSFGIVMLITSCATNAEMMAAQDAFYRTEAAAAMNPGSFQAGMRYELMCYFLGVPPRVGMGRGVNPYLTPSRQPFTVAP